MRQSGKCPKCSSENILGNAHVRTYDFSEIVVDEKLDQEPLVHPSKREKVRYAMAAWVCGDCGYTELYCL